MKYRILFLCVAGMYSFQMFAQNCDLRISGTVFSADKKEPLAFASVQIKELNQGVMTDSLGKFEIEQLCPGNYTLICNHHQCHELVSNQALEAEHVHQDFFLTDAYFQIDEVDILGEKNKDPPIQQSQSLNSLQMQVSRGEVLGEALAQIPGISMMKTGSSIVKPVIHGLHSNRILILNNGIRQEAQQWGSDHGPEIDPFIATNITLVKGAASVRYGAGAIGGVVLINPAPLRDSVGLGGTLDLVGFSNGRQGVASAMIEGNSPKLKPFSWRLQSTVKKGGNMHTPDYYLDNTGIREQNFSAAAQYKTFPVGIEVFYSRFHSRLGIISSTHLGGQRELEEALSRSQPIGSDTVRFRYELARPYQQIRHNLAKVHAYRRIQDIGKLSFTYAYQYNHREEFDKHKPRGQRDDGSDLAELDFRIYTHSTELLWEQNYTPSLKATWGIGGIYQNNHLRGRPFIPNFVLMGGEAFSIHRLQRGKWDFEAGVRYDYRWIHSAREERGIDIYTIQSFQNVSASLGTNVHLAPGLHFNSHLGAAWRPPHVNELFSDGLHHGSAVIERGDSTLQAEQGIKWTSGLEYVGSNGFSGLITTFYHYFPNYIYNRPAGTERTVRGTFPVFQYAQTRARLYGLDIDLRYELPNGINWEGKGAYLDGYNLDDDEALIFMPPNWLSQHVGYQYKTNNKSEYFLKVGIRKVFEQKKIPTKSPEHQDLLPPPKGYTLVQLECGSEIPIGHDLLYLTLTVDNLFNVVYRDYLNRFRYYTDEPGRNISFKLRYQF